MQAVFIGFTSKVGIQVHSAEGAEYKSQGQVGALFRLFVQAVFIGFASSRIQVHSAEGAEYKSQGQVRSEAEHVAPGYIIKFRVALKGA